LIFSREEEARPAILEGRGFVGMGVVEREAAVGGKRLVN
jgi:hypothetical protein